MMIRRLVTTLIVSVQVCMGLAVLAPVAANAATAENCVPESPGFLGFPTWYKYLEPQFVNGQCEINATFPDALPEIALAVFEIVLRISGFLAVLFIVYGGFQYITTTGEPEKAKNARTTIINAIVGLVISIMAVAIVNLIAGNIA